MRLNQGLKEARQKCIKGLRLFNIYFYKKTSKLHQMQRFFYSFLSFSLSKLQILQKWQQASSHKNNTQQYTTS